MKLRALFILVLTLLLFACATKNEQVQSEYTSKGNVKGNINDPIMALVLLTEQQRIWAGTPYRLGGNSRKGIDCSAFVQKIFLDHFNIALPRTTIAQAKYGQPVVKTQIQTGDLVFFKTGRGPNGYHVGIYVKDGLFLHASTKGGVIYSALSNPYWKKRYWQARRII